MKISPIEFVTIWQTAETKEQVRKKTGLTDAALNARAARYRLMGINLKDFRMAMAGKLNITQLSALAESLQGENHDNQPT